MKNHFLLVWIFIFVVPAKTNAQLLPDSIFIYPKPKRFSYITNIPGDFVKFGKRSFTYDNAYKIAGITAGTLVLIAADQYLLDKSKILGRKLEIDENSSQKTYLSKHLFKVGPLKVDFVFNGPHDSSSLMYFLGDGWYHAAIAGSYWIYGLSAKNNRALQTATAIAESMIVSGIATQFVKHITGRQSPFVSDVPGGRWRFFPNQVEYHKNVPQYDAYPSGHVATAISTTMVIADMYPEYKFIRPLGYAMTAILGYAMMNNGAHWISDYPLGIAFGYTFAKIAVQNARKNSEKKTGNEE